ncbi:DUF937 domain-containing protein [Aerococcaceae bacterium DSM 111020]|nr:DUF937 domain-containing protein [Aerococcaceae bacterium DSM 111020]
MGLFDNTNLLDMFLPTAGTDTNQQLAQKSGLDLGDFSKIAAVGLPAILNAIQRNNGREGGLNSFDNALTQHQQDLNQYDSADALAQNVDPNDGEKILGHVFDNQQSVFERIGNALNLSPDAVKRALIIIAPVVLKYLADRKNTNSLDQQGVEHETANTVNDLNQSIQNYGQQRQNVPSENDWFGPLKNNNYQRKDNGGILDMVFDIFK